MMSDLEIYIDRNNYEIDDETDKVFWLICRESDNISLVLPLDLLKDFSLLLQLEKYMEDLYELENPKHEEEY